MSVTPWAHRDINPPTAPFYHYLSLHMEDIFSLSSLFSISAIIDGLGGSGFERGCWKLTNTPRLFCTHLYASWPNSPHPLEAAEVSTWLKRTVSWTHQHKHLFLFLIFFTSIRAKSQATSSSFVEQGKIYLFCFPSTAALQIILILKKSLTNLITFYNQSLQICPHFLSSLSTTLPFCNVMLPYHFSLSESSDTIRSR